MPFQLRAKTTMEKNEGRSSITTFFFPIILVCEMEHKLYYWLFCFRCHIFFSLLTLQPRYLNSQKKFTFFHA